MPMLLLSRLTSYPGGDQSDEWMLHFHFVLRRQIVLEALLDSTAKFQLVA